jgi:hypothetical protein
MEAVRALHSGQADSQPVLAIKVRRSHIVEDTFRSVLFSVFIHRGVFFFTSENIIILSYSELQRVPAKDLRKEV